MSEETRSVLLQVAGYLTMIARGITPHPSQKEAEELLDRIGGLFPEDGNSNG